MPRPRNVDTESFKRVATRKDALRRIANQQEPVGLITDHQVKQSKPYFRQILYFVDDHRCILSLCRFACPLQSIGNPHKFCRVYEAFGKKPAMVVQVDVEYCATLFESEGASPSGSVCDEVAFSIFM